MQDYKNLLGHKFKKLEKEIEQTFSEFRKLEKKPSRTLFDRLRGAPAPVVAAVAAVITVSLVTGGILHASQKSRIQKYGVSPMGMQKIREEFDAMSNPDAMGGVDIKTEDTNSSELKFYFYKIKQGESLLTVSKKLGVSMDTLISLNTMGNAHSLSSGQRLLVPNVQGILYTVKKNDTLDSLAKKYKISIEDIMDANDLEESAVATAEVYEGEILFLPGARLSEAERAKALGYLFVKPVFGRFTSGFGIRRDPFMKQSGYHAGIDIGAGYGTPVKAAKEGRVVYAGWYGGYGKVIFIKHLFGYETVYGHLSSIQVKKDQWVKQGQYIGRVGSTGRSTGAHLHFEVRKYGRPTNPVRQSGLAKGRSRWY